MFAGSGSPISETMVTRVARMAARTARGAVVKLYLMVISRQASAYCDACGEPRPRDTTTLPSTDSAREAERPAARLQRVLGWAWVAFLLLVVGYATVEGERVLAELDSLKVLAAYSTGVRRMVRPERVVPAAAAHPRQSPSATRVP